MDYKVSKIEKYFRTWFFENDDLIVPNLGKFTTTYQNAQVNDQINHLSPPNKKITFSEDVKVDPENSFIGYIAQKDNISTVEAEKELQNYITNFKFSLAGQKKETIDGFGVFLFTDDEKIKFQSDENVSFLSDSYGLPSLFFKPLDAPEDVVKDLSNTADESTIVTESPLQSFSSDEVVEPKQTYSNTNNIVIEEDDEEEEDDRSSKLIIGIVVVIIIAIIATLAITQFSDVLGLSSPKEDLVSAQTDDDKEKEEDTRDKEQDDDKEKEEDTRDNEEHSTTNNTNTTTQVSPTPSYNPTPNYNTVPQGNVYSNATGITRSFVYDPTPPNNLNEITVSGASSQYYVVLGSFQNQTMAYSMHNNLKKHNINSKIIINNGRHRVAVGGFSSSAEATQESGKMQSQHGIRTWILKY